MNRRIKVKRPSDTVLTILIWISSFATAGVLVWILGYIVSNGISYVNWEFVSTIYKTGKNLHGILPFIITTLYLVVLTVLISTPIGICSAIYLVEYSKPGKIVNAIRFATESLAGIPSIIYGLFGYIFFVIVLKLRWSILSGALTLSIMVLPTIVRATEEALKAVPASYREGSLALGATPLETIRRVVLPCAMPGILAAVILSIGRIIGETAAVYLTVGYVTRIPEGIMSSGRTLSVHLYHLASQGESLEQAFATATILIILVAVINLLANKTGKLIKRNTTS